MRVGVPKEVKSHEYRVGLTDGSVRELVEHGHTVFVETNAGASIGMTDDDYARRGAEVVRSAAEVFARSDLIVKVKEPLPEECAMLRDGQILFTYLHLAPNPRLVELLLESRATAIAYETVTGPWQSLPLLAPMSEVAGRISIQAGAHCLERDQGGQGILLGGVPGVAPGKILIIGGGVVGDNAAHVARGLGADVTILDRSIERLRELDHEHEGRVRCVYSKSETIEKYALEADLVIGAVLVPGATAAKVLTHDVVRRMKAGSVFVDVAIDQGGCSETSRPTTHPDPTYVTEGVVHYCVTNMPGVVPKTSTLALNNATLPFVLALADLGLKDALAQDPHLANGLNIHHGKVTHPAVARDLGHDYASPESLF